MVEKKEEDTLVVKELPKQEVNIGEVNGKRYNLITIEDALTEILEKVRKIEKVVG